MSYLQSAFDAVCKNAKQPEGNYVCLVEEYQRYGGPEEGGWYATVTQLVAYEWCATAEEAEAKRAAIEELAKELQADARRAHGDQCNRELDWLEARGLDADWLPEPDGPSEYRVIVADQLPTNDYGPTHYE